jgi:ABC-2 type transport system permease protein
MNADAITFSPRRIAAMVLRYWYLLRSSWARLSELVYWPAVQMLMWGFLQTYLAQQTSAFARAGGVLVGAVMLWDILFRGQLGFSISFLEEMYARNLGNLMISPLRASEFIVALMIMSVIRLLIGMVPVTLLAIAFFGFNLWALGLALAAWSIMFLFLPLTCAYYPVAVLPPWLQVFAWALPPTYVFEGMRALLMAHTFRADLMFQALALNAVWFAAALVAYLALLASARRNGSLMQSGE